MISNIIKSRGWKSALAIIKETKIIVMRKAGGNPLKPGETKQVKQDNFGNPKFFPLNLRKSLNDGCFISTQEVLTILRIGDLSTWWPKPDLETLCSKSTFDTKRGSYGNLLMKTQKCIDSQGIAIPKEEIIFKNFHLTNKQGPFGHGLKTALIEFCHLDFGRIRTQIEMLDLGQDNVFGNLRTYLSLVSFRPKSTKDNINPLSSTEEGLRKNVGFRRLGVIKDPGGKARIVAIFDYWTQTALRPLHLFIIHNQAKWFGSCDLTMNQRAIDPNLVKGPKIFSYDLTAATDRLPMEYQKEIVSKLLGAKFAENWKSQLVDHSFYVPWTNSIVKYMVGQPMGAYTSWALLALSHHLIVRVAGHNVLGHYNFNTYYILGDDIVIWGNSKVAREYRRLIEVVLGVKISEAKTLESADSFEFAKRFFVKGVEVSPLPWTQLDTDSPLKVLPGFLASLVQRKVGGYDISLRVIKLWIGLLVGLSRKTMFHQKPIQIQSLIHSKYLGVKVQLSHSDIRKFRLPQSCNGNHIRVFEDLTLDWLFSRLWKISEQIETKTVSVQTKIVVDLGVDRGNAVLSVPFYSQLKSSAQKSGHFVQDLILKKESGQMNEVLSRVIDLESTITIGDPDFSRKENKIAKLQASASMSYLSYSKRYARCLEEESV